MSLTIFTKHLVARNIIGNIYTANYGIFGGGLQCVRKLTLSGYRSRGENNVEQSLEPKIDMMLRKIRSSNDTSHIFTFIQNNTKQLEAGHIVEILKIMFSMQKSGESNINCNEILKSKEFINLCKSLKRRIRELELNQVVESLKILSYFNVPVSSIIIQSLLQIIRNEINDLNLQQITFLNFILKDFEQDPLSDALKIAMPIVFDATLRFNIDKTNPSLLVDLLSFCSKNRTSSTSTDFVAKCLLEIDPLDWKVMDTKKVRSIIWSICENKHTSEILGELFQKSVNAVLDNISLYSYLDFQIMLKFMTKKFKSDPSFSSEEFCDASAKLLIEKSCTFLECCSLLRNFNKLRHVSISLLEYLGSLIADNPKELSDASFGVALTFIDALVLANYKTDYWSSIELAIVGNKHLIQEERLNMPWLKLVVDLSSLDIFIDSLLEKILKEKFLNDYLSREYNILDYLQLLNIYQVVQTLHKEYSGPLPPENILSKVFDVVGDHVEESLLQTALENGFGGPSYVHTKCFTKLGHYIDHVIVMRKGGFPIAFNKTGEKTYIEDIVHPADSQKVLVLSLPSTQYASNIERLRGQKSLEIRTLEALGHIVVPISVESWKILPDYEKIPYLMRAVKSKCESLYESEQMSFVT